MPKNQSGLTLIEMIVTIVTLAIALVTISIMLSSGLGRSADTLLEVRTVALAQSYLDEVLGKRFDESSSPSGIPPCRAASPPPRQCSELVANPGPPPLFGPDPGETRAVYDDVDDYDGLDEGLGSSGGGPLRDAQNDPRIGYDNFRVQVEVAYISGGEVTGQVTELNDQFDAKRVTVTVTHPSLNQGIIFSGYKSNF